MSHEFSKCENIRASAKHGQGKSTPERMQPMALLTFAIFDKPNKDRPQAIIT